MAFWVRERTVNERAILAEAAFEEQGEAERYARGLAAARRQEGFAVHQDTRDQYWLLKDHIKARAIQIEQG